MPTERFLRLSEEKKRIITNAARIEFSKVPVDKVSINKIIADAGISRGSFYTYFEDKWDLLKYMIESNVIRIHEAICNSLAENNGDLWFAMEEGLVHIMNYGDSDENLGFVKNTIFHLNPEDMNHTMESGKRFMCEENQIFINKLYEKYNRSIIREMSEREFGYACEYIFTNLCFSLSQYFNGKDKDVVIQEFKDKCSIIKYGICVR